MSHHDLIIIGSGPAGRAAAIQAGKLKRKVLVIDRKDRLGGVSVHTGTIPSKTLRETVMNLSGWRERSFYGRSYRVKDDIHAGDLKVRLNKTLDYEVDNLEHQFNRNHVQTLMGSARFTGPHAIEVATHAGETAHLTADRFLIATGTRTHRPEDVPFNGRTIVDSDDFLDLATIPRSLIVVGAGVIGVEYATMFTALDVRVTLIEPRATFLDFIDRQTIQEFTHQVRDNGLDLRLGAAIEKIEDAGAHVEARVDGPEVEPEGVAADVRSEDGLGLGLAYGEERGPVRAPGAQRGPAHRQAEAFHQGPHPEVGAGGKRLQTGLVQGLVQDRGDPLGNEFAFGRDMSGQTAQDLFTVTQEVFDEGVGFLQDQDPVASVHEDVGRFVGERKRSPEFEDRDIGEALLCQQVGHGGARHPTGHDAQGDSGGRGGGSRIERCEGLEALLDGFELLVQFAVELQPEFWCGGPTQGVPFEGSLPGVGCNGAPGHVLPRMADPDRRPKDDRKAEFRRKVHRGLHHLPGLLGRGGIEDRHLGKARHEARVLFGLGGVRPRIVARDDDQRARNAEVG